MKRVFSLQGKFTFLLLAVVISSNVIAVSTALYFKFWGLAVSISLMITIAITLFVVRSYFGPIEEILQALRSGVASFKDHDYSVSIARTRDDELGELITVYNGLAATLRAERFSLFQRELLLDTVIQSSSVAVVIANLRDIIVFSNRVARDLFGLTEPLEGHHLQPLCEARSPAMDEQTRQQRDGLFTMETGDENEVYHLTCRRFNLNGQIHRLFLYKQLTREIARQEVETWKKVIRVISHELNNSLAPISSLSNSAQIILQKGGDLGRLNDIFSSISSRSSHLHEFIEQYARFARLPKPRMRPVEWPLFIADLKKLCDFRVLGETPDTPINFDPVQMEQVLINLLKNAVESGSATDEICLRILFSRDTVLIAIEDRGPGLEESEMAQALLPFYSTKRKGSGLGLPLCREIVEAHGGSFRLSNRPRGGLAAICQLPLVSS